jgi:hypothetical protein
MGLLAFTYISPLSLTAKCLALPGKLSTTTVASKPSGKNRPPFFSRKQLVQTIDNKQIAVK